MAHPRYILMPCLAIVCVAVAPAEHAVAAPDLIAGTCLLDLEAERTEEELGFVTPSDGLCVTSAGIADGVIEGGGLRLGGEGCTVGVVDGWANFEARFDEGTLRWQNMDLEVVYAGPVIDITVIELGTEHIIGNGQFVQVPPADEDCETTAGATFTWSGVFTFEDPVLE